MIIEVKQEDIDHGKSGDCVLCPIGRASRRAFGSRSLVTSETVTVIQGGSRIGWFFIPREAVIFISKFDRGETVYPFSFDSGDIYDYQK